MPIEQTEPVHVPDIRPALEQLMVALTDSCDLQNGAELVEVFARICEHWDAEPATLLRALASVMCSIYDAEEAPSPGPAETQS